MHAGRDKAGQTRIPIFGRAPQKADRIKLSRPKEIVYQHRVVGRTSHKAIVSGRMVAKVVEQEKWGLKV